MAVRMDNSTPNRKINYKVTNSGGGGGSTQRQGGNFGGGGVKGCGGGPMATQHQTQGGYRSQWSNVGAGHQHQHPGPGPGTTAAYFRYTTGAGTQQQATQQQSNNSAAVTAAAVAAVAASTPAASAAQQAAGGPQQNQVNNTSYTAANTNNYNNTNSYGNQRVPTATSPSNTSSSNSSHTGSQSGNVSALSNTTMPNNTTNSSSNNSSTSGVDQLSKTNLYIRGLNPNTSDKDLENMCQQYGTIISTKAILDKNTNKCKGYGFVDFDSPAAAEGAVKALTARNIQAQMAKVGIWYSQRRTATQQEQDPTNLYIANLPTNFKESDLESLLSKYGHVVSTRILRDGFGVSKGVGFARMENKERCDQIIQVFNNSMIQGSKEPLLVKFADGGNKKKSMYKNNENTKVWRDGNCAGIGGDNMMAGMQFEHNPLAAAQNGVTGQPMMQIQSYRHHYSFPNYPPTGHGWMYPILQAPHLPSVEDGYGLSAATAGNMTPQFKNDAQGPRAIPVMMPSTDAAVQYTSMIPQLTAQMGAMQIGTGSYMSHQYAPYYHQPIIHAVAVDSSEHTSNAASPEDPYPSYQPAGPPK